MESDSQLLDRCIDVLKDLKKDLCLVDMCISQCEYLINYYDISIEFTDDTDILKNEHILKKVEVELYRNKEVKNQEDTMIKIVAVEEFIKNHYPDAEI